MKVGDGSDCASNAALETDDLSEHTWRSIGNMGKIDDKGYRRMLGYVVVYRGVLNLDYAESRLHEAKSAAG